jgi:hypothetical protein|tara:strand:+ start:513 stop:716 length:204 start_codon:yes stop_codon:yes gene_type:complete
MTITRGQMKEQTMAKKGLYYNINQQKKNKKSRSKKNSTISPEAYANMEKGFPKKLKDGGKVVKGPYS